MAASDNNAEFYAETDAATHTYSLLHVNDEISAYTAIKIVLPAGVDEGSITFSLLVNNNATLTLAILPDIEISISVKKHQNHQPASGVAGGMLFCDGIDDFAYDMDFVMPEVKVSDRSGIGPGTVEFW